MSDPQTTLGKCATCKFWDKEPYGENLEVRECNRVLEWWDATEWKDVDNDYRRVWKDEAKDVLAFANDGSSYTASLITRPEFGCVMHEEKKR